MVDAGAALAARRPDRPAASPWNAGPYGERARRGTPRPPRRHRRWSDAYHALAEVARRRPWVVTHGEPRRAQHDGRPSTRWLVDWETVRLAPAERDWRTFVERGLPAETPDGNIDRAMLDLFDLEWRLDEINQYAAWFSSPHTGPPATGSPSAD